MSTIRNTLLFVFAIILVACAVTSLGFDNLNYPVSTKKVIGKLVLIVPVSAAQRQFTIPAKALHTTDDQIVSSGQMLVKVADYEYPKIFSSYERVTAMSAIKPGFYRAIMQLYVQSFEVDDQVVQVSLHAKLYSYQGRLLYEKSFSGKAKITATTTLQAAALEAYRSAIQQVNDRLEQVLYWEDHADSDHD